MVSRVHAIAASATGWRMTWSEASPGLQGIQSALGLDEPGVLASLLSPDESPAEFYQRLVDERVASASDLEFFQRLVTTAGAGMVKRTLSSTRGPGWGTGR